MTRTQEKLRCAKCKTDGIASWDEVREPQGRGKVRTLVALSAGFKSLDKGARGGPVIQCANCNGRVSSN